MKILLHLFRLSFILVFGRGGRLPIEEGCYSEKHGFLEHGREPGACITSESFQELNVSQFCYVGPECAVMFALWLNKSSQDNLFVTSFQVYPVPSP